MIGEISRLNQKEEAGSVEQRIFLTDEERIVNWVNLATKQEQTSFTATFQTNDETKEQFLKSFAKFGSPSIGKNRKKVKFTKAPQRKVLVEFI